MIQTTIHQAFATIYDPRQASKVEHPLINIVFMGVCAALCGADDWVQTEAFAKSQEKWLAQFLDMSAGVPCHDTFGNVFAMLHCEEFSDHFREWVKLVSPDVPQHIAVDGKLPRGSRDKAVGRDAIDMVSAFATATGLTLAQHKVDEKSNEITAIPALLEMLELKGCVITIDAIGCQTEIVKKIDAAEGDAIIALKGNQGSLHEDTVEMFRYFSTIGFKDVPHSHAREVNKGHGRIEVREAWAFRPNEFADYFRTLARWPAVQTVIMRHTQRQIGDIVETETRYYLSTLDTPVAEQMTYIRNHWRIENGLHWVLDVAFREDRQRMRKQHSAANAASLRHIVLNLLRMDKSKGSIATKRMRCAWDTNYRQQVLEPILQM